MAVSQAEIMLPQLLISVFIVYLLNEKETTMSETRQPLRRSKHNRLIAGVCGGLGEFFGISPTWFRLAFLLALLPGGIPGILLYLLCWIIIPGQ
jgi:phage shock protein PspC (stress-responsive transcriptional regulator)